MSSEHPLKNLKGVVSFLYFGDGLLRLICLNTTLFGLATFYVIWMLQPYWQDQGIPLTYFGLLWAAMSFVIAFASKLAVPMERKFGAGAVLALMGVLPVVGYFGMSVVGGALGIALSFAFFLSRGINQVILSDALNRRTPGSFRATANSIVSFMFRGIYIVTGPMVGLMIDLWGMNAALAVLGLTVIGMTVFCLMPLIIKVGELESEASQARS
jgi:hypothetical protein